MSVAHLLETLGERIRKCFLRGSGTGLLSGEHSSRLPEHSGWLHCVFITELTGDLPWAGPSPISFLIFSYCSDCRGPFFFLT